jgi:hypothetical protein
MEHFESLTRTRSYRDASLTLPGLVELLEFFAPYEKFPSVKALTGNFEAVKKELFQYIYSVCRTGGRRAL